MAGPAASPRSSDPLRFGHNPLCRRSDRLRRALHTALVAGICLSAALGALVGLLRYEASRAATARASEGLAPVGAVTLEPTPPYLIGDYGSQVPTKVTWSSDGTTRQGYAPVDRNTGAGTHVTIWLDVNGNPVTPPGDAGTAASDAVAIGLCVTTGAAVALNLGYWLGLRRLERSALASWEREWAEVEPAWSRRA